MAAGGGPTKVIGITPDGRAYLEDGREMRLAVSRNGVLGLTPITPAQSAQETADLTIDQAPQHFERPPTFAEMGLDQLGPTR